MHSGSRDLGPSPDTCIIWAAEKKGNIMRETIKEFTEIVVVAVGFFLIIVVLGIGARAVEHLLQ